MSVRYFFTFIFYLEVGLAVVFCLDRDNSLATFCGLQHTDDYMRTSNIRTSIDEFPWLAALIYKFVPDGAKAILCSGVLINRRYVLTAAQCLTHPQASILVAVRLGEYNTRNVTDCVSDRFGQDCTQATDFGIEEKIVHPQYNRKTGANDIALLRTNTRINEFSDYIRPICLKPKDSAYHAKVGDTLQISGWGRSLQDGEPVVIKKKVNSTLLTNEQCAREIPGRAVMLNNICTKDLPTNTEFVCQGDAGAPVMFVYGSVPQWHLEGISSWGARCGAALPHVHTRVFNYIAWIETNVRD